MPSHSSALSDELRVSLERLFSLQTFGIKLGLEPITALLAEYDNPHLRFPTIHVAGTNGKGSVCALVASTLSAAGLRVGLYTSPHLVDFSERIRVNGVPIGDERLARYAREMLPAIERYECTFFEGTTAIGFRCFAEEGVDVAVIETGMGGRLDATNVITPLVSAITSIGFDHTKHLGKTLASIAAEKAGIIKPGVPAVVGVVAPRLRSVFTGRGETVGADVGFVGDIVHAVYHSMSFEDLVASFIVAGRELPRMRIGLIGRHQIENARVALATLEHLRRHFALDDTILHEGFSHVRRNTGIRGRLESLRVNPRVVIDVAHNADGARVLVETLSFLSAGRKATRFVYGAVEDKDVAEIVKVFDPVARHLYAVRADNPRSLPADEIAHWSEAAGIPTTLAGSVATGLEQALNNAGAEEVVVICGSFFVAGEAMSILDAGQQEPDAVGETGPDTEREPVPALQISDAQGSASTTDKSIDQAAPTLPVYRTDRHRTDEDPQPDPPVRGSRNLTVKEWNESEQPRERLMKLGAKSLNNAELLAILLRSGTKAENVLQVSANLIQRFGSLSALAARDYRELQQIAGIGPTKAVTLAAAFEIGRRLEIEPFSKRPKIESPGDVARIYIPRLRSVNKEQFHVLVLNTANQVIRTELVSEGSLNSSIVHPREVFRIAIVENAASIIGLHNHPSGNPTASKEDINITRQLSEAGRIIGIAFHDHIIIAGESYVSLAQEGYL